MYHFDVTGRYFCKRFYCLLNTMLQFLKGTWHNIFLQVISKIIYPVLLLFHDLHSNCSWKFAKYLQIKAHFRHPWHQQQIDHWYCWHWWSSWGVANLLKHLKCHKKDTKGPRTGHFWEKKLEQTKIWWHCHCKQMHSMFTIIDYITPKFSSQNRLLVQKNLEFRLQNRFKMMHLSPCEN